MNSTGRISTRTRPTIRGWLLQSKPSSLVHLERAAETRQRALATSSIHHLSKANRLAGVARVEVARAKEKAATKLLRPRAKEKAKEVA